MKLSALIFAAALAGCATSSLPATQRLEGEALDARIEALMAREQVVGMAVAVVDRGEITHLHAYGLRNRENALPLQTDTIMYGASVTAMLGVTQGPHVSPVATPSLEMTKCQGRSDNMSHLCRKGAVMAKAQRFV